MAMENIKELLGFNMRFPFMLRLDHRELHKVQVGATYDSKGNATPILQTFIKNGTMDIVSNPNGQVCAGYLVKGEGFAVYRIVQVKEQRSAKGDFRKLSFLPVWQRCEIEFYKTVGR